MNHGPKQNCNCECNRVNINVPPSFKDVGTCGETPQILENDIGDRGTLESLAYGLPSLSLKAEMINMK
jgi:hypothetical protein